MNRLILPVAGFALALLLLLWVFWPSRQLQSGNAVTRQVRPEPREVVLYFADSAATSLVSEEQQIAGCNDERQCVAQTLEALAAGSQQLQPVIPTATRILGVEIENDLARINFSRELVNRHPGGSLSELLTVYSLTNTLAVNFPHLQRFQFLIEGQVETTLKGHVAISRPIKPDFRYSQILDGREEGVEMPQGSAANEILVPQD